MEPVTPFVVSRASLSCDPPICGVSLEPYVVLRRPDGTHTHDELPEESPVEGVFLRHRWCVAAGGT